MSSRTKFVSIILSTVLLAGCGQPNNTASTQSHKLRVGMECNYAPFNWSSTTSTSTSMPISSVDYCDGYDVEVARQLADELGLELEVVKYDWDNLIPGLQNNEIDAVIAGMTETDERKLAVDFTSPYYTSQEVIIVRADSDLTDITNIQQLSQRTVKGQLNTLYDTIIDQIDGVNHGVALDNYPALVNDLLNGGSDAITAELPVAEGIVAANPNLKYVSFTTGNGFEADSSVSIAVRKGNTDLLNQLQNALNNISEEQRQQMMVDAVNRQPAVSE